MQRIPITERLAKYSKRAANGCLLWTGGKHRDGYGATCYQGRAKKAHRVAWEVANGPILGGLHVLHRCDTPACINVDHLFLGTAADNARDRSIKGRTSNGRPRGRTPPKRKGTDFKQEVVRLLQAHGLAAEKFEAKRRRAFKSVYRYLGPKYGLVIRDGNAPLLVVLRLEDLAALARSPR